MSNSSWFNLKALALTVMVTSLVGLVEKTFILYFLFYVIQIKEMVEQLILQILVFVPPQLHSSFSIVYAALGTLFALLTALPMIKFYIFLAKRYRSEDMDEMPTNLDLLLIYLILFLVDFIILV